MSNTLTVTFNRDDVDQNGRIEIPMSSDQPLPAASGDYVQLQDTTTGDWYFGDILDHHDCYAEGGTTSFIWVELT